MRLPSILSASVVLALGLGSAWSQQQPSSPVPTPVPTPSPTATPARVPTMTAASAKPTGMGDAVTVHGYWRVDVHNADGSLATHREFENSLVPNSTILYGLLLGREVAGGFNVRVAAAAGAAVPAYDMVPAEQVANPGFQGLCSAEACSANLTTTLTPATSNSRQVVTHGNITLQGQFAPTNDFDIVAVQTFLVMCADGQVGTTTVSPHACSQPGSTALPDREAFTGTSVSTIHVAFGQYALVSVVLSFS